MSLESIKLTVNSNPPRGGPRHAGIFGVTGPLSLGVEVHAVCGRLLTLQCQEQLVD